MGYLFLALRIPEPHRLGMLLTRAPYMKLNDQYGIMREYAYVLTQLPIERYSSEECRTTARLDDKEN